jgi:hypothetical protein
MDEEDIIEEYEQGDRVNALVEDEWRPGIIDGIESYTVFNPETRRQRDVTPEFIRGNIGVGNEIEFRANLRHDSWTPGTIVSINYWVNMQDLIGGIEEVSHLNIRRRAPGEGPEPEPEPEAEPAVQPAGLAWEVHNAFSDLDLPKFMTIIRRENNGASNFKDNNNILEPIVSYINGSDTTLTPEQKTRYINNIRKTRGIIENVNAYIREHPDVKNNTLEVIQFVLSQDPKYKDLYIEIFENECMGGYSTGNRQSCIKGMFERIYMANKGTIEGLCFEELQSASAATTSTTASCKPVYLELYSAFTPGSDIDINDIFYKWYNQFSYDAVPEEENILNNLSVEARKQHFRDFVRQDEAITPRIWNNRDFQDKLEQSIQKNSIIFETLSSDAGLGKRRRKRRNTVKHIFSSIGKKKKKHNRKTMKKHLKKSIRKRKY